jgi:hypothetical protein
MDDKDNCTSSNTCDTSIDSNSSDNTDIDTSHYGGKYNLSIDPNYNEDIDTSHYGGKYNLNPSSSSGTTAHDDFVSGNHDSNVTIEAKVAAVGSNKVENEGDK